MERTWLLIAIGFMFLYFCCESINTGRTLKALGEKSSFFKNLKYTLICFFFIFITPAASGGQSMEIYYMHKDGINVEKETLILFYTAAAGASGIWVCCYMFSYRLLCTQCVLLQHPQQLVFRMVFQEKSGAVLPICWQQVPRIQLLKNIMYLLRAWH